MDLPSAKPRKCRCSVNKAGIDITKASCGCRIEKERICEGTEFRGRTVTLKVKYADFQQITRSRTGQALFSTRAEIEQLSYALLKPLFPVTKGIRLLGLTLSSLGEKSWKASPNTA
jgi:nucleotidyltransferase/DNA polymerase involved in DNA repair